MTEVAFHFNVPDKTLYLCRLLRKVVAAGKRALVLLPAPLVPTVDQALWTFSQEDFLAHALEQDTPTVKQRSAIVLASQVCDAGHQQVLINCLAELPPGFERFERVLEIVGSDEAERAQARQRWRAYVQQGYDLIRHDVAQRAA
ncbi:MAG TPA: DNA polymerase III subunit chi [Macromonas sp.]|nr:DNA polymerase III subunit chi [Macromonas sp.]